MLGNIRYLVQRALSIKLQFLFVTQSENNYENLHFDEKYKPIIYLITNTL